MCEAAFLCHQSFPDENKREHAPLFPDALGVVCLSMPPENGQEDFYPAFIRKDSQINVTFAQGKSLTIRYNEDSISLDTSKPQKHVELLPTSPQPPPLSTPVNLF